MSVNKTTNVTKILNVKIYLAAISVFAIADLTKITMEYAEILMNVTVVTLAIPGRKSVLTLLVVIGVHASRVLIRINVDFAPM
jgi:TRAP-type C4-dicarboxylate transport system permease small subunit